MKTAKSPNRRQSAFFDLLPARHAGCNAGVSPTAVDTSNRHWARQGFAFYGNNGMSRRLVLGVLFGAALGNAAWAQGLAKFDGQYMGELTLTKEIRGDCTQPPLGALYPLTISRGEVRFVYLPRFGTTLRGKVAENGTFEASARARKGVVRMTGRVQGSRLSAHIVSPSCNYTFQTKH